MKESVMQEIRKSHCARKGSEHSCAGSCTITPKGIELSCHICGNDKTEKLYEDKYIKRANSILKVIGLNLYDLSHDKQIRILQEVTKDYCPGCGASHIHLNDYVVCTCGYKYSHYRGWEKA